ncbi:hypothetical protein AFK24_27470 [Pseudomonas syringae]|uniref:Uncharacterized protein n=1 Tax=Pseudomonas syringae TaxID=317 RepID=A0A1C7YVF3_PSESX|nr:hypothetical protein [Pseudomonas syringae]OCR21724.1 hypothetical protein AFK24_27470 [Pseudomonas syringae]
MRCAIVLSPIKMSAETRVVAELKTCLNLIRKIDGPSVSLAVAPLYADTTGQEQEEFYRGLLTTNDSWRVAAIWRLMQTK